MAIQTRKIDYLFPHHLSCSVTLKIYYKTICLTLVLSLQSKIEKQTKKIMFLYKKKKGKNRCLQNYKQSLKFSEKELVRRVKPKIWKDQVRKAPKSQLIRALNLVWLSTLQKGFKITSKKLQV